MDNEFSATPPKKSRKKLSPKALFLTLLLIAAFASSFYLYQQWQQTVKQLDSLKKTPAVAGQEELKTVIDKVSTFITLPDGETPTLATITDVDKLKDQPFFANAQNGDKILIYAGAKKAYLYSPKINKLVDVAPVNIGTPSASPSPAPNR